VNTRPHRRKFRNSQSPNHSWIKPAAGALACIVSCLLAWSFPPWKFLAWLTWAAGTVLVITGCLRGTRGRLPGILLTRWAMTAVTSTMGYLIFF